MTTKPHGNFHKVARRIRVIVASDRTLKPRDKLLLTVMLDWADRAVFNATGMLVNGDSVEMLAARSSLGTRDVERARGSLRKAGIIECLHPSGRGQASQMRICLAPVGDDTP